MKYEILPPAFSSLTGKVDFVVRRTQNEYSSSCPICGGSSHKNGEPSDRFRMFLVSKYSKPLGWCRHCGYVFVEGKDRKPTREEIETWQRDQIRVEQERKEAAERALELLQNERMWEKFFVQNNAYSNQLFAERGISPSWVEYLRLGLVPDYTVKCRENGEWQYYHSPAISIPVWGSGGVVQNIKLRVTNPRNSGDRYRNWYEAGQSYLFVPMHDLPLTGTGIVVEGEFKATVLEQTLDDPKLRVVGLQSKTPSSAVFDQLKEFELVYVWLDPDAFVAEVDKEGKRKESSVERVVRMIGKERCRVVKAPVKVDDGIVKFGLNPLSYLRMARKP